MTTAAVDAPARRTERAALAGVPELGKLITRRERIRLPIWCYALLASVGGTAYSFHTLYPTPVSRAAFAATVGKDPALSVLYGKPFDLTTLGGLTAWRMGVFGSVLLAIMSIVTVVRHTRAEEEAGRFELVGAGAVGRHAPLIAVLRVVLGTQLALGVLVGAVLTVFGEGAAGAFLFGLAMAACGWFFAGVAAITVQLTDFGRSAGGLAFTVLGVAYLLRALGAGSGAHGPTWLSWLSPIGWTEQAQAFAGDRWWVLILGAAGTAGLVAAAFRLAGSRDLGGGIFPARPGPAEANRLLRSAAALGWRMQRGALIGWGVGLLLFGAVLGAIADSIVELVGTSAQANQIIERMGGQGGVVDAYLASCMNILGVIVAFYAIAATVRLRAEETSGRAEPLLAAGTARVRWAASHLVYPVLGSALLLALSGLAAGLAHGGRSGEIGTQLGQLGGAALIQAPAVWVVVGLTVAVYGFAPRATAAVGWSFVGLCILLQELGPLLQLSHWITDVSPFATVPRAPGVAVPAQPLLVMSAIGAVLTAAGLIGLRRRDIG
jgi:ABC-2 type transport system permease protein